MSQLVWSGAPKSHSWFMDLSLGLNDKQVGTSLSKMSQLVWSGAPESHSWFMDLSLGLNDKRSWD